MRSKNKDLPLCLERTDAMSEKLISLGSVEKDWVEQDLREKCAVGQGDWTATLLRVLLSDNFPVDTSISKVVSTFP